MQSRDKVLWFIRHFPKGSIWQTRYVCMPIALVSATLAVSHSHLAAGPRVFWFLTGVLTWTFLEYILHRWVLHWHARTEIGKAVLERLHTLHHATPADQTLVCVPPTLVVSAWSALFLVIVLFGGNWDAGFLFISGLALMMVTYDIAHFSAHYMPATTGVLRAMKKHHLNHHFADHRRRFGVTSPLWDHIFRTN